MTINLNLFEQDEAVKDIISRSRKRGKVLLIVPSQFNVYGVRMKPAYPALGVMWVAAMLEKAVKKVFSYFTK